MVFGATGKIARLVVAFLSAQLTDEADVKALPAISN